MVRPTQRAEDRREILALLPGEFHRIFRPPFEVLLCLVANGVLATLLWYFSPIELVNLVFTFHISFLFPTVLATWMLADVPATNQLAPDPQHVLSRLDDPTSITELLRAKQIALWVLTTPVALAVAVIIGAVDHKWLSLAITAIWVATVPLAGLGLSCFVGVRWPYHPISLKARWAERHDEKGKLLRWGVLVLIPYAIVPVLGAIALIPPGIAWEIAGGPKLSAAVDNGSILFGACISVPVSLVLFRWGTRRAGRLAHERREQIRTYLMDPSLG
jgi:hypothetical protein